MTGSYNAVPDVGNRITEDEQKRLTKFDLATRVLSPQSLNERAQRPQQESKRAKPEKKGLSKLFRGLTTAKPSPKIDKIDPSPSSSSKPASSWSLTSGGRSSSSGGQQRSSESRPNTGNSKTSSVSIDNSLLVPPPTPNAPGHTLSMKLTSGNGFGSDPKHLLSLINASSGHMRGNISFRRATPASIEHATWQNTYVYVRTKDGSLRYEATNGQHQSWPQSKSMEESGTLLSDLRECETHIVNNSALSRPVLQILSPLPLQSILRGNRQPSPEEMKRLKISRPKSQSQAFGFIYEVAPIVTELRPINDSHFQPWLATLLAWQATRARQEPTATAEVQRLTQASTDSTTDTVSDSGADHSIVIKDDLAVVESDRSPGLDRLYRCILRADGELSIANGFNSRMLTLQINTLPSSAILHSHPSVTGHELAIAIFPSFGGSDNIGSCLQPVILSFSRKSNFERWMSHLKQYSQPEIFQRNVASADDYTLSDETGPSLMNSKLTASYRLRHAVTLCNIRFELEQDDPDVLRNFVHLDMDNLQSSDQSSMEFRVDALVDHHVFARTTVHTTNNPYRIGWTESIEIEEVPTTATTVNLRLVGRRRSAIDTRSDTSKRTVSREVVFGEARIFYNHASGDQGKEIASEVFSAPGHNIGSVSVDSKRTYSVLPELDELDAIVACLTHRDGVLSVKLYKRIQHDRAKPMAILFLDIYSGIGRVVPWLKALLQYEIDLVRTRMRTSSANGEPVSHNTLFRDNTLLTRAFDEYMKRIAHRYLKDTIGDDIASIMQDDYHCEIDPNKPDYQNIPNPMDYLTITAMHIWSSIQGSARRCPTEMRILFKHAGDTAAAAFGPKSPQRYSSVTAFLFLRFFCSAIIAPYQWELVLEIPPQHVARTYVHISKAINNIANLSTLRAGHSWMEPLNNFSTSQQPNLRRLLSDISALDSATPLPITPVPVAPGVPVVPGLLDPPASLMRLARWWNGVVADARDGVRLSAEVDGHVAALGDTLDRHSEVFDPEVARFTRVCGGLVAQGRRWMEEGEIWREEMRVGAVACRRIVEGIEREEGGFWDVEEEKVREKVVEEEGRKPGKGKGKKEKKRLDYTQEDAYNMGRVMGFI